MGATSPTAFRTARELASDWGVSLRTIRALAASGELPSIKIAGARRFDPKDIKEYLDRHSFGSGSKRR